MVLVGVLVGALIYVNIRQILRPSGMIPCRHHGV